MISSLPKKTVTFSKTCGKMAHAVYKDPHVVGHWMEDLGASVRHGVRWVKNGFKLFAKNVQISKRLVWKAAVGHQLTLRESKLLVTTTSDIFKLVPFSLFIIIPFAELALPIFLRVFPNMLPSTFIEKSFDSGNMARRVRAKKELAEFFESVIEEGNRTELKQVVGKISQSEKLEQLSDFRTLLTHEQFPSVKEIVRFAKLFEDEFKVENMPLAHLQQICKMLGIEPFAFKTHVVLQLRHYVNRIQAEDRRIIWEGGVDSLDLNELEDACAARGMHVDQQDEVQAVLKQQLEHWLELSSTREVPISLLLWTRAFVGTGIEADRIVDTPNVVEELPGEEIFEDTAERQKERAENVEKRLTELEQLEQAEDPTSPPPDHESKEDLIEVNQKLREELTAQAFIVDKQEAVLDDVIAFIARVHDRPKKIRSELYKFTQKMESDLKEIDALLNRSRPVLYIEKDQRFYPSDDEDSDDEGEQKSRLVVKNS